MFLENCKPTKNDIIVHIARLNAMRIHYFLSAIYFCFVIAAARLTQNLKLLANTMGGDGASFEMSNGNRRGNCNRMANRNVI